MSSGWSLDHLVSTRYESATGIPHQIETHPLRMSRSFVRTWFHIFRVPKEDMHQYESSSLGLTTTMVTR